jgi:hypothetical protein
LSAWLHPAVSTIKQTSPASPSLPGEKIARSRADDGILRQAPRFFSKSGEKTQHMLRLEVSIMTRKRSLQGAWVMVVVLFLLMETTHVHAFTGGSGARIDPYLIATAEDLMSIGSDPNLLQSHFRLVNDIDLDPNLPGGKVFDRAVIAPPQASGFPKTDWRIFAGSSFTGSFDGNGYSINNLILQGEGWLALFGKIGASGMVYDLSLRHASVGRAWSGPVSTAILAVESDGSISNCHVQGVIGSPWGGVLVDTNRGTISCCNAISHHAFGQAGLVAVNKGVIRACYAVRKASRLESSGGGLVRTNWGAIIDCYATGDCEVQRSIHRSAGGLVGDNRGTLSSSYTTVSLVADPNAVQPGALVGNSQNKGPLGYSCFLETANTDINDLGIPLSDPAMKDANSFTRWDFHGSKTDGPFDNWFMPENAYPVLSWQTEVTGLVKAPIVKYKTLEQVQERVERMGLVLGEIRYDYDEDVPGNRAICISSPGYTALGSNVDIVLSFGPYDWAVNPGSGQADSPLQIYSPGQFHSLTQDPNLWEKHFILTQDIDMGRFTYTESPIAPDANDRDTEYEGEGFTGCFDGNDFCLSNLNIIASDLSTHLGLFGYVSAGAEIKNLTLTDHFMYTGECSYAVGVLAGRNLGIIDNCRVTGMTNIGPSSIGIGGLVGVNDGVVQNCSAACLLLAGRGNSHLGGLVGDNFGRVGQSWAGCRIWGGIYQGMIGGLAGYHSGEIHQSHSSGEINVGPESESIGGLVGEVNTVASLSGSAGCDLNHANERAWRHFHWQGRIEARISQSHTSCDIFCNPCCTQIGGFAGIGANIYDCYAAGRIVAVNPNGNLGGFAGMVENVIKNNYSSTEITVYSSDDACGKCRRCEMEPSAFIGKADSGSEVLGCFHFSSPTGDVIDNGLGTALTEEQMRLQESFVGWDFLGETDDGAEDIWVMSEGGYSPMLAWETLD